VPQRTPHSKEDRTLGKVACCSGGGKMEKATQSGDLKGMSHAGLQGGEFRWS
jgi:hypothetical protein